MRVVDLSSRPFVNRRPVARVSSLLWAIAAILLLVNLWMYTSYWSDAASSRDRLAALDAELESEQERLVAGQQRLDRLALGARNDQASFLNGLIDQRTFPWSRLFEDLESVLPRDVRLLSVVPSLESDEAKARSGRGRSGGRFNQARSARTGSTAGRSAQGRTSRQAAADQRAAEAEARPAPPPVERVSLDLPGTARDEESLFAFVENLYESELFANPFLGNESRQQAGEITFSIQVEYLVPRQQAEPLTVSVGGEAIAGLDSDPDGASARLGDDLVVAGGVAGAGSAGEDPEDGVFDGVDPEDGALPRGTAAAPGERAAVRPPAEEDAGGRSWTRPSTRRQARPSSAPPATPRETSRSGERRVRETSRDRSTTVIPPVLRGRSTPPASPQGVTPGAGVAAPTGESGASQPVRRGSARDGSATSGGRGGTTPLPRQRQASGSPQVRFEGFDWAERLAQVLGLERLTGSELVEQRLGDGREAS